MALALGVGQGAVAAATDAALAAFQVGGLVAGHVDAEAHRALGVAGAVLERRGLDPGVARMGAHPGAVLAVAEDRIGAGLAGEEVARGQGQAVVGQKTLGACLALHRLLHVGQGLDLVGVAGIFRRRGLGVGGQRQGEQGEGKASTVQVGHRLCSKAVVFAVIWAFSGATGPVAPEAGARWVRSWGGPPGPGLFRRQAPISRGSPWRSRRPPTGSAHSPAPWVAGRR